MILIFAQAAGGLRRFVEAASRHKTASDMKFQRHLHVSFAQRMG